MIDWGQIPPRNLPDPATQWGRDVEKRIEGVRKVVRGGVQSISGANRSDAAVTADLARQIKALGESAEDLEDALLELPVISHGLTQESGVQVYGTWDSTAQVVLDIPEGKTRGDFLVVGYQYLWGWGTDVGSGGGGGGGGGVTPSPGLPTTLSVTSNTGGTFTMNSTMIGYADIIRRVAETNGANREAVIIAFMTVFVESVWLMYANSNVPDSLNYPHEAVGSDHESLGLFQQQTQWGWGSTAELMDVAYNAAAFIGGPSGPNGGNPPGLLDIPGWENMPKGVAAQTVQDSSFPDRYALWEQGATELYAAIAGAGGASLEWPFVPAPTPEGDMPPVGSTNEGLAEYGPRTLTGSGSFHEGIDFGYRNATAGATIGSAGPGTVYLNQAGFSGYGNAIIIYHGLNNDGFGVYTLYAHRQAANGPSVGATVSTGDFLGTVGNSGQSFGAHLHFEVHLVPPNGSLMWDNNNPSYDSTRTTVNPRDYVGSGSISPDPTDPPGPGGVSRRLQSRINIGGVASEPFQPSPSQDFRVFRTTWGRTVNVSSGSQITIALQSITDGGSTFKKSASIAFLTVIASFS